MISIKEYNINFGIYKLKLFVKRLQLKNEHFYGIKNQRSLINKKKII